MAPWYNVYCLGLFNTQISYESFTCTRIYARAFNLIIFEIPKAYFGFFFLISLFFQKSTFFFLPIQIRFYTLNLLSHYDILSQLEMASPNPKSLMKQIYNVII